MALSAPALADVIKAEMISEGFESSVYNEKVWNALSRALVNYFVANTQVVVSSVAGVTPGGGVSGPGTGTIV